MAEVKMAGAATRAAAGYDFQMTPGRSEVIKAYDQVFEVLSRRAQQHDEHGNRDLRETTLRIAQRSMSDFELLCRKWVESDAQGKIY